MRGIEAVEGTRLEAIGERALKWVEKYLLEVRPLLGSSVSELALFLSSWGRRMNVERLIPFLNDNGYNGGLRSVCLSMEPTLPD